MLPDEQAVPFHSNRQDWMLSWHPPASPPAGIPHGSVGICLTASDNLILVSRDGVRWDFPAGRPEEGESWEDTLRREVLEEACARVVDARLLGYSRGECVRGPEEGRVLVRAYWRAAVELDDWGPRFEISHRRLVPGWAALDELEREGARLPLLLYRRALAEARVPGSSPT